MGKRRTPYRPPWNNAAEAVQMVMSLPKRHRPIIGRIVWWDFFALKLVANRVTEFDHWIGEPPTDDEPSAEELAASLMQMGYGEKTAIRRFTQKTGHRLRSRHSKPKYDTSTK